MDDAQTPHRRFIVIRAVAALLVLLVVVAIGVHLSPARRLVLRSVLPIAERRASLRIQAESLDYNLFRLTATLRGVKVAATQSPDLPFFEADSVDVAAPSELLRGVVSLTRVGIAAGRVRILRTANGSNLPTSSNPSESEPAALRLGRITADVSVDVRDEVAGVVLQIPSVNADLSPLTGQLTIGRGTIGVRGQTIALNRLAGGAAFDGRALQLRGVDLDSDVATARLDGSLTVITRTPAMALMLRGQGTVERLTAIATPTPVFTGAMAFEGSLAGPLTAPVADLRVRSDRLERDRLALTAVDVTTRVTVANADISQSTFGLAGGRVNATGHVEFNGSASRVDGTWTSVDVPRLIAALVDQPPSVLPAGSTSGTVSSAGSGFNLTQWTTAASVRLATVPNARGRLTVPGESRLRMAAGAWRLEGAHRVGDVAPADFRLNGTIQASGRVPLNGTIEVATTQVDALASMLTRVGLAEIPPALLTRGAMTASAMLAGDLEMPALKGDARLEGLIGNGFSLGPARVSFDALPLDANVHLDVRAESARVAGQPIGLVDASASIRDGGLTLNSLGAVQPGASGALRASGTYQFASSAYQLQADVSNWTVTEPSGIAVRGVLSASFTGGGTVDRPGGNVMASLTDAFYSELALGNIAATATLDGVRADFDVSAPLLSTTAKGRTDLGAPYTTAVDVDVERLDLSRLRALTGDVAVEGTMTATAHAEGAPASWRDANAVVNVMSAEGTLGELAVALDGASTITYASRTIGAVRLVARAGGVQAELRGSLPIEASPTSEAAMTLTVIGDVGDLLTATRATGLADVPPLSGRGPVAILARVEGAVEQPRISADIDLGPASLSVPDLPTFERVRVLGHVENGRADVQDLFASVGGAEVTATASAPLSWASSSFPVPVGTSTAGMLSARIKNLTADLLGRLGTGGQVPDLEGSLDASVELTSATPNLEAVSGEARIDRLDVSAAGVALTQRVPTRVVAADGFARVAAWDWTGDGSQLSVTGQVRLSNLQAGILANGDLDLRLLSPFLRGSGISTAGRVSPRLSITGELTHPLIDGDIVLGDADVRLATPRVFISGLNGTAIFSRDNLQITALGGSINGGDLKVGGGVAFPEGGSFTGALTADVTGMALEFPDGLRTEIAGSLMLDLGDDSGGLERVPLLTGSLRVVNGSYRAPVTVVGGLLAAMQSRANAVAVSPTPDATPAIALDVTLTTEQDIVVDNNVATLSLDADLRLIGTTAQPALSGRAEIHEGGRVLLGRNTYQITMPGTLDFADPDRIDPELNFQLTTRTGSVSIDVTLTGTTSAPTIALSSDRTELSQADLRSLLATGQTLDQLSSADAGVAAEVLVSNLSGEVGQVLGLAGRIVGLDAIRLGGVDYSMMRSDPTNIATETDPTTRLTFSKSIGSNVDVTYSQSLRDGDQQTWVIEVASRRLLARLISNDVDLRTYEFRHDVQFGGNTLERSRPAARPPTLRVSTVTVDGTLPGQDLSNLIALEAGSRFDFETLQDDRERIETFYREQGYLTVRVGARQTAAGEMVTVAFTIQPGPRTRIEVTGAPLSRSVLDELAQVWADSIAGPLLIEEARTLVEARFAGQGYLRAKVDVQLAAVDGVQVLTIASTPGPRTSRVSVVIAGASDDLTDDLNKRLVGEKLVAGAPTNPQAVSASLQRALRELGYVDSRVTVDSPTFDNDSALVNVRVEIGEARTFGAVTVTGSTLPADRIGQVVNLTEGSPFVQEQVDSLQPRLRSLYRQEGYPSATVDVRVTPGPAAAAAVAVTVREGPRQMISTVHVEGLRGIAEDAVQRAMALEVGQAARAEDLLRARTRLFTTGLFRRVDVASEPDPDGRASDAEIPMRVLATVEEWPAVRLRYGLQVAEERPDDEGRGRRLEPGLSGDLTRRTLFGRSITVGAATVMQRRQREARLFASSPTFVALPLRSSVILEKTRTEFASNRISDTTGISWEQRARVLGRLDLSYSYRFDRQHVFVTGPGNPDLPEFDITLRIARLIGGAAWDSRNEPAAPSRGWLFTSTLESSPESLGSDIRFVRYFGQVRHFQSVGRVVLASSFQYGVVTGLGGQEVISSERFFTGGSTSIRGLPEDGAGPRDFFGPLGGRTLVLINQEARVPLYRWFQGVGFVDAGNVFETPGAASLRNLATSVGVGLRVATPFAMLRVDFGRVLRGGDDSSKGRFSVGVGHVF